ncbi:MAG: hypothetical protein EZS28_007135 [Streblomastix strix]|uniref:Uncharacterized protein n=1 Tax=Streblomastix strix TaxID=222440 RepID=A0A5J4WT97_9EUKA|nr:MAG: hypothetical protein EZS28_007135 [Streblomastix strix]
MDSPMLQARVFHDLPPLEPEQQQKGNQMINRRKDDLHKRNLAIPAQDIDIIPLQYPKIKTYSLGTSITAIFDELQEKIPFDKIFTDFPDGL